MPNTRIREDELIERIRRRIPSRPGGALRLGIGDDAAILRPSQGAEWVLSCDQFLEGVHFLTAVHPPEVVGYKALARATSDLAAMGARPRLFLLSLVLPAVRAGIWLEKMTSGMARAARRFSLTLAGGDTARSVSRRASVALNLTVLGEIATGHAVSRAGARAGDAIFASGRLGSAELGLQLVLRGIHRERRWRSLLVPHYCPELAIELGRWLAGSRLASAMMDLSDGLSTDLSRLCRASRVGARIDEKEIPAVSVPGELRARGLSSRALALHGGEDYGLLFTVSKRHVPSIPRVFGGQRVTCIGEIVPGRSVKLVAADGGTSPLMPQGWDHFRRSG